MTNLIKQSAFQTAKIKGDIVALYFCLKSGIAFSTSYRRKPVSIFTA